MPSSVGYGLILGLIALLLGLGLHVLAVWLRDFGPSWESLSISFRGNGALVVLPIALVLVIVGDVLAMRRRAWLGLVLVPVALFAGLFVVAGSF